ncbi:hypothetical protein SLE2022_067650 [Rubroshorea leprosula]
MGTVGGFGERAVLKSWAQQTEESYQLQHALVLRLSSLSASAVDPNFLTFGSDVDHSNRSFSDSPEAVSYRFWVNGSLSYNDRIPNGFYLIHGMDPYTWTISADQQDGWIPSFESLKGIHPRDDLPINVVLIDKSRDPGLEELQNWVLSLSNGRSSIENVVNQLAGLVCNRLGGVAATEEGVYRQWMKSTDVLMLKNCQGSAVLPIGSLPVGLCIHRALLFKVLADLINLPCRIAKGCKFCTREDASSCLVRFDCDREYLVDLFEEPGALSQPDSSLNSMPSIAISSPLCHPRFKPVKTATNFRTLAKLYFFDSPSYKLAFGDSSSDSARCQHDQTDPKPPKSVYSANLDGSPHLLSFVPPIGQDISWGELVLKEKLGVGSFGTVHRANWHGYEVAVKILEEQNFYTERFREFLREVAIMKSLRHPNIVRFLGAVTQPPKLSIVMEYLSRGSLYKLLQMPNTAFVLNLTCRLNMAYDVASGMNYLHQLRPPIVHRDLKSPNLLVTDNYTVKVCDFGLSRSKANTFLTSKTGCGTPEWMAPEVLRDEPSNEKSDIYSFGVVLWELVTLQQPWKHLTQLQVVATVGFKNKRLEIPSSVNPGIASLIQLCWANEPSGRPSFSYVMESLQQLIRNSTSQELRARTW